MKLNRNIIGWMLYDFANSAFTTIIVTVVYSRYFVEKVVGDNNLGSALWGRAIAISMLIVAITTPVFGAIADYSRSKKKFLFINSYLSIIFTSLLFFVREGDVFTGMLFFILANVGYHSANVFYNSFLPEIADEKDIGKISGMGWALGYVGGLISLIFSLILVNNRLLPWVFPTVAFYFLIFSTFTLFWVKELKRPSKRTNYYKLAFNRISDSLRNIKKFKQLVRYLISYFIYNDGITTVIAFTSIYGMERFGISTKEVIRLFIYAQFTSIIGAWSFGYFADKVNLKLSINISLIIWIAVVIFAFLCQTGETFLYVVLLAGIAIGSSQANSRTMLSCLTPKDKQAEFFGFYSIAGSWKGEIGTE
jgi:UMF1 family MFS transporter